MWSKKALGTSLCRSPRFWMLVLTNEKHWKEVPMDLGMRREAGMAII